ncbi:hypothetical protein NQZ68_029690 [Dissostichus eleginoides]|nr:hypothetical protein NQZ68_029690 [Dissostichus eleginoides]
MVLLSEGGCLIDGPLIRGWVSHRWSSYQRVGVSSVVLLSEGGCLIDGPLIRGWVSHRWSSYQRTIFTVVTSQLAERFISSACDALWMEVWSSAMGPERVLPNSEDDLGGDERPGALLPVWGGGEGEIEGEEEEEEEEEENNNDGGGYYYQPLNQEPEGHSLPPEQPGEDGEEEGDAPPLTEQLQQVQHRIQDMGLHLPEAPPSESEDEEEEGASALRSRASIPMDEDHVELVKRTMASVALPALVVPPWAKEISEDQWKDMGPERTTTTETTFIDPERTTRTSTSSDPERTTRTSTSSDPERTTRTSTSSDPERTTRTSTSSDPERTTTTSGTLAEELQEGVGYKTQMFLMKKHLQQHMQHVENIQQRTTLFEQLLDFAPGLRSSTSLLDFAPLRQEVEILRVSRVEGAELRADV